MLTYLQAIVIALIQGVTELFPVSSLGHSVLVPAWIGGSWETLVTQSSEPHSESSFYLAFLVALHVATALALLWFFRADWIRIITGFFRSARRGLQERRLTIGDPDERLAWLIIVATIPVGITGLALEHVFRTALAKPVAASAFLFINGLILLTGDRFARRQRAAERVARRQRLADGAPPPATEAEEEPTPARAFTATGGRSASDIAEAYASDVRISGLSFTDSLRIGILQIFALFAGISRSGITMVGGLWRGLSYEDSARYAFLLATPVILAAGVLKLPSLFGKAGDHIHGQVIVGMLVCGVAAYFSVRYLVKYFENRTLLPFAMYCLIVGGVSFIRFAAF
jgi:undecaprenyl-diphosphatase